MPCAGKPRSACAPACRRVFSPIKSLISGENMFRPIFGYFCMKKPVKRIAVPQVHPAAFKKSRPINREFTACSLLFLFIAQETIRDITRMLSYAPPNVNK